MRSRLKSNLILAYIIFHSYRINTYYSLYEYILVLRRLTLSFTYI
jgi:hypothetical protein